jgi:hypothetical protein
MDDGAAITLTLSAIGLSTLLCALIYAWEKRKYPGDYFTRHFPDAPEPKAEPVSPEEAVRLLEGVFDIHNGEASK